MKGRLLLLSCLAAGPAGAFELDLSVHEREYCTCIEAEPIRSRVFVGTVEGFHYLDSKAASGPTATGTTGSAGRSVHPVASGAGKPRHHGSGRTLLQGLHRAQRRSGR